MVSNYQRRYSRYIHAGYRHGGRVGQQAAQSERKWRHRQTTGDADRVAAGDTDEVAAGDIDEVIAGDTDRAKAADIDRVTAGDDTDRATAGDTDRATAGDTDRATAGDTDRATDAGSAAASAERASQGAGTIGYHSKLLGRACFWSVRGGKAVFNKATKGRMFG